LHPLLPVEWVSKALRVAMSESDWAELHGMATECATRAQTQARAYGMVISGLLHRTKPSQPEPGLLDWMDWERRKALRLLVTEDKQQPQDWMDWERRKILRLLSGERP
jgi:hypothetical protein